MTRLYILMLGLLTLFLTGCAAAHTGGLKTVRLLDYNPDVSGKQPSDLALEAALQEFSETGGVLLIPRGTFLITRNKTIPANLTIKGEGRASLFKAGKEDGSPKKISGGGMFLLRDVTSVRLESISFDINAIVNYSSLIQMRSTREVTISNCIFLNSNRENNHYSWTIHGIEARDIDGLTLTGNYSEGCQFKLNGGVGYARNVNVRNNEMKYCHQMGVSVVAIPRLGETCEVSKIDISDNVFNYIDDNAVYVGYDIGNGQPDGKMIVNDVKISNNRVSGSGFLHGKSWHGILVRATEHTTNVRIFKNEIINEHRGKWSYGINVRYAGAENTYCENIEIYENVVEVADHGAITLSGATNSAIYDNVCSQGNRGIEVLRSKDVNVYNNNVEGGGYGIHVQNAENITLTNNRIEDCKYGIMLRAETEANRIEVKTNGNRINARSLEATAIFTRGSGTFIATHSNNELTGTQQLYGKRGTPRLQRVTVDGKKIPD